MSSPQRPPCRADGAVGAAVGCGDGKAGGRWRLVGTGEAFATAGSFVAATEAR